MRGMDIAEYDRLSRLSLQREVDYILKTQGPKAAQRARRVLSVAIDDQRHALIQAKLAADSPH